jgi:hypothetical protein
MGIEMGSIRPDAVGAMGVAFSIKQNWNKTIQGCTKILITKKYLNNGNNKLFQQRSCIEYNRRPAIDHTERSRK